MPSVPVRVVPYGQWSLMELCTKTHMAAFLLRPDSFMSRIPLGLLRRCQRKFPGVRLHVPNFLSNHYHLLVSTRDPLSLARFMNLFNSLLARVVNLYLGRRDAVWGHTYSAIRVMPSKEAERAMYVFGQGLEEGLFERVHHNPCAQAVEALTQGKTLKGLDVDLAAWSQAKKRDPKVGPEKFCREVTVQLHPLPGIEDLAPAQQQAWWRQLAKGAEAKGAERRKGAPVLGAEGMRKQDPFKVPAQTKSGRSAPLWFADEEEAAVLAEERSATLEQRAVAQEKWVKFLPLVGMPDSVHIPADLACAGRRCGVRTDGEGLPGG